MPIRYPQTTTSTHKHESCETHKNLIMREPWHALPLTHTNFCFVLSSHFGYKIANMHLPMYAEQTRTRFHATLSCAAYVLLQISLFQQILTFSTQRPSAHARVPEVFISKFQPLYMLKANASDCTLCFIVTFFPSWCFLLFSFTCNSSSRKNEWYVNVNQRKTDRPTDYLISLCTRWSTSSAREHATYLSLA